MNNFLLIIRENINWVKDLATIIFTAILVFITFKSYKRAKETIFQPIRSEVIKKQASLLTDLLQFIKDNNNSFFYALDYQGIINTNTPLILEYFKLTNINDIDLKELHKQHSQAKYYLDQYKDMDIRMPKSIEKSISENFGFFDPKIKEKRIKDAKEGNVSIFLIYLTNKNTETTSKISNYTHDPFMPKNIQIILYHVLESFESNLKNKLRFIYKNIIHECFSSLKTNPQNNIKIDPIGVYNNFNKICDNHDKKLIQLIIEIRKYLRVDNLWR